MASPPDLPRERAPRKDVERNRARLLDAGREVFAERGLDATLEDIARRAGVGAGTAYRHFGGRADIIRAIFSDAAKSFIDDARAALAPDDPWDGFVRMMLAFAERQAADRGLHQVFTGDHGQFLPREDWETLIEAVEKVVARARLAGAVRGDLHLSDVIIQVAMMGPAYDVGIATSAAVWRRHLAFFLDAAHVDGSEPVIDVPAAVPTERIAQLFATDS